MFKVEFIISITDIPYNWQYKLQQGQAKSYFQSHDIIIQTKSICANVYTISFTQTVSFGMLESLLKWLI